MNFLSTLFARIFCATLFAAAGGAHAQGATLELTAGLHRIEAEIAATQAERTQGLMHRRELPAQRGMLFVFPQQGAHCMWMRNTRIALAVAFLDEAGTIVNIEEMQPETETTHCARAPVRYALEMNKGWFAARKLGPGARINGVARAPQPQ